MFNRNKIPIFMTLTHHYFVVVFVQMSEQLENLTSSQRTQWPSVSTLVHLPLPASPRLCLPFAVYLSLEFVVSPAVVEMLRSIFVEDDDSAARRRPRVVSTHTGRLISQWLNYSKVGDETLNSGVDVDLVTVVKFSQNGPERRLKG